MLIFTKAESCLGVMLALFYYLIGFRAIVDLGFSSNLADNRYNATLRKARAYYGGTWARPGLNANHLRLQRVHPRLVAVVQAP